MPPAIDPSEIMAAALQHFQQGRFAEAEQAYRQVLQQQPNSIDALNFLGALLYQQSQFDAAIVCFQQVLTLQPANPDAYNSMGIALKGQGNPQAAVNYYRRALALQPNHAEVSNNLGNALKELGELEAAIASYQQALALKPSYPQAHNNLGVALKDQGKLTEAIAHYHAAIAAKPDYPEAHHNLGNALQRQGNLAAAIAAHQQALTLRPHYPEAYYGLGNGLQHQGKLNEAVTSYQQAIGLKPNYAEAYHNLANTLQRQGKLAAAIAAYQQALGLRPDYAEAHNNLGNALQEQGQLAAAIVHYQQAITLRPDFAEAYSNLGAALKDQKKPNEAIPLLQTALALRPDYAEVHNNLGNAYQDLGDFDRAIDCYHTALALNPDYAEIHSNLGNMLQQQGKFEEAFDHFQQAIAAQPTYAGAYNNLGIALRNHGQIDAAFVAYDRAIDLNPDFIEAHWNKALTQLLMGDYQQGFAGYDRRFQWSKFQEQNSSRSFTQPPWDGLPLAGKIIFLHAEQGMGDTIQFIRYAPLVAELGGQIIVECQAPLVNLIQSIPGIQQVIPAGTALPFFEVHAPLMSLPRILGTTLATIPATVPYLAVKDEGLKIKAKTALSHSPLPTPHSLPIGIVWSGNPENPYNRSRACPLSLLLTLANVPNVQLYSLQKDPDAIDLALLQSHPQVKDLRSYLTDFAATAAIIDQLDLIITVDTAVAHLAGALGKPVWLLLPFAPDWRWLLERNNSPWYPTMRLFRQPSFGDWAAVLEQVQGALRDWRQGKSRNVKPLKLQPGKAQTKLAKKRHQPSAKDLSQSNPLLAARQQPIAAPAILNTAIAHYQAGDLSTAETICRQVLQQQPEQAEALHILGVLLCQTGQAEASPAKVAEGVACFQRVLAVRPRFAEAWANLGNALQHQGKSEAAIAHYQQAIALKPDYADAHYNLALVLQEQNCLEEALIHCQQAVALNSSFVDAHYNLGFVLRRLGRLPKAIASYRRALQLSPNYAEAHKNLGHALLLTGNFLSGFQEYEWRWRQKHWSPRSFPQPVWDGSNLQGKTLLLHAEQGLGDTIQFIRYAKWIRDRVRSNQAGNATVRIVVECQAPLLPLLRTAAGIDQLVAQGEPLPAFDVHAPLLSLPYLLKTTLKTIPANVPYLTAPPSHALRLEAPANTVLKVGIAWMGNPDNKNNALRSCSIDPFCRLILPGVAFYSLQKGIAVADLDAANLPIQDLSQRLNDFADTAAAIAQLDLVITIDTSVAHLAGALGKPVWVLLSFAPDWRWLLERNDSPWYPTMRLFRQPSPGDWQSVFDQVADALKQLAPVAG